MISGLTDNFLFDVTALVAVLQSATTRAQFQSFYNKYHDKQISACSVGTKEGKEGCKKNFKKPHNDQLTNSRNFLTNWLTASPDL